MDITTLFGLCHQLAKRNNPSFPFHGEVHWTDEIHADPEDDDSKVIARRCLICYQEISQENGRDDRYNHGMQHIKDSGLLPFI